MPELDVTALHRYGCAAKYLTVGPIDIPEVCDWTWS